MKALQIEGAANGSAQVGTDGLSLTAAARTDWFFHPAGETRRANVIRAVMTVDEVVFTLSAKVSVDFRRAFDAGSLFVQVDEDNWAKLAFELSGAGEPTVVSVITRGTSDDADGPSLPGDAVWLRVHGNGDTLAFHFSVDGRHWRFLRWFTLPGLARRPLRVGVATQAPTGEGCSARFSEFSLDYQPIVDLRNGS
ncbi:DUF1349 domain-containing protein [Pseudomonas wadenswilerensis]